MRKLNVGGTETQVLQIEENDYISLTDMVREIDNGSALIEKWLRNKDTIEFFGIWEELYNADFNTAAYEEIMLEAELNCFIMSVKAKHAQPAVKVEGTKEWVRTIRIVDLEAEEYKARKENFALSAACGTSSG